jgi:hypothetical protein
MIETREGAMPTYEYGRIRTLEEKLVDAGVDAGIIAEIMAGGSEIRAGAKPEKKSDWLHDAMLRMDDLLDEETRHAVRAACACCLGGKRHKLAQEIYQNYGSFEERVRAANETPYVFGHSVTLQEDGQVLVSFFPESESYRCACLPKAREPISITYCYCCGGHVRHHMQTALGVPLAVRVVSSALSSGGKESCKFLLRVL